MKAASTGVNPELEAFLARHESKGVLRFITCGSVDDGKSSMIGRLLYDTQSIFDDQLRELSGLGGKTSAANETPDLAFLLDGLQSEREQGITIDVAYRYFTTERRKFIIADTPGHEQYTRNMATGASTADLAVVLIDARKGILTQTRRHSYIVSLLGIRRVVLAVNKMDLVGHDPTVFERIAAEYRAFAEQLNLSDVHYIPMSALEGDNIVFPSQKMPWYVGPPLLEVLETAPSRYDRADAAFRFPVQRVNRPNADFRGFSGTVASGSVSVGDDLVVLPSGRSNRVKGIVSYDGDLTSASAGDAVTLVLEDETDIARGDLLARPNQAPRLADQFMAHIVWMNDDPMIVNRVYLLKIGTRTTQARLTELEYRLDINTLERQSANGLGLNDIGVGRVMLDQAVAFDTYEEDPTTGAFIIIDKVSNTTVGAGMVDRAVMTTSYVYRHETVVDKAARSALKGQKPCLVLFTGLSGAGKSAIANAVEQILVSGRHHTYLLDANNLRHGINSDLGFSSADRAENLRRAGEIGRLFVDAGLIALLAFIAPEKQERRTIRDMFSADEFIVVFVDTPLETCIARDPNGLYAMARAGEIPNFTGINAPYERPAAADLTIDGAALSIGDAAMKVVELLRQRGIVW